MRIERCLTTHGGKARSTPAIISVYHLLVYILRHCLLVSRFVSNSWTQMISHPSTREQQHRPPHLSSLARSPGWNLPALYALLECHLL